MTISAFDAGCGASYRPAGGYGSPFEAGLFCMVGSDTSLHVNAPEFTDHDWTALWGGGAFAACQQQYGSNKGLSEHLASFQKSLSRQDAHDDVNQTGHPSDERPADQHRLDVLAHVSSGQHNHQHDGSVDGQHLNNAVEHVHPSDDEFPFNLSPQELQLLRRCRAADRAAGILA